MKKIYKENPNIGLSFLYNTKLGRIILKPMINNSFVSNLVGLFFKSRLSCLMINKFVKNNNIDMSEYVNKKYKSFNDFFIRDIKDGKRTFSKDKDTLCACCDSYLTHHKIRNDLTFEIKGTKYTIDSLLNNKKLANSYKDGDILIFRLAPNNYHHYYFPFDGTLKESYLIKGKFHSVNPIVYDKYAVYKENTRNVSILSTKLYGDVIYMEVGALLVGKIKNNNVKTFTTGDEKGYFEYGGSTVILIFKNDKLLIDDIVKNTSIENYELSVKLGEKIRKKKK